MYGKIHTEQSKLLMSLARTGKVHDNTTKEAISAFSSNHPTLRQKGLVLGFFLLKKGKTWFKQKQMELRYICTQLA